MHPDFFSLGPFSIHTYGVMMALGFLAGLGNWIVLGRREGHSAQFCTDLMFWVMVSGIAGARTAYVLENWQSYAEAPMTIFRVDQGGLIFYGGLVASGVAIAIFARRHRLGLASLFDFALTSVPLAHALGRVGCFLNGCCYGGLASSGGCGVQFPKTSIPWVAQVNEGLIGSEASSSLAVHPVQLYEAGFNVLVYGLMVWMFRRRLRPGMLMAVYLMLYAVGRFTLEYWRGDRGERLAVGFLSIGQFVSVLAFILGLSLLVVLQVRRSKEASHD
jgi:phosphatidylglycerol:prolipoprotein diacylglycerol transferase